MIYFDNAASTPMIDCAKEALLAQLDLWGNPSSLHRLGFEAEKYLKRAREQIAATLHASPEEITFTSGGTESDNLALFGIAHALRRRGNTILATDSEHPAVEEVLKSLESEGFTVHRLSTRHGALNLAEVEKRATPDTILCAMMHTNNETGAVYDIAGASRIVKQKNPEAIFFCDAVQGYLKEEICPARLGVDLMALSSHKIHGPKGVGALYIRRGVRLIPRTLGGGQERGLRSGTENLAGIVSFAAAATYGFAHLAENRARMQEIKQIIQNGVSSLPDLFVTTPQNPSCHILSLGVLRYPSEVLLHMLSERDVFVSSGSACSSHKGKSPVLTNFGLTQKQRDCTIRLSFSGQNTTEEARRFVNVLKEILS